MQAETLLAFPHGVAITNDHVSNDTLHLVLTATAAFARCPMCRSASPAQHSHSQRSVQDVPCGGDALRLQLRTRRFLCRQPGCTRRMFPDRFPAFLLPRARMTERFREALLALSATTAHEAAQRLASLLQLPTSVATRRRQLGRQALPDRLVPTKIGIDDVALRKRTR